MRGITFVEMENSTSPVVSTSFGLPERSVWTSVKRGWAQTCPCCGKGQMYGSYLKVNDACPSCGEALHHQRADDAPPYFTMMIVGHVVVGGILVIEKTFAPDLWLQLAIWLPAVVLLSLWLLPRVKGALIGYQWAVRMHGFGPGEFEGADLAPLLSPVETMPAQSI